MSTSQVKGGGGGSGGGGAVVQQAHFFKAGMVEKLYGRTWMKKFLVLDGSHLLVFKKQTPKFRNEKPEQSLSLTFVSHVAVSIRRNGGRSYFHLSMFDNTSHLFSLETVAELGPWVELIAKAAESVNTNERTNEATHEGVIVGKPTKEAPKPPEEDAVRVAVSIGDTDFVKANARSESASWFINNSPYATIHIAAMKAQVSCLEVLLSACESRQIDLKDRLNGLLSFF